MITERMTPEEIVGQMAKDDDMIERKLNYSFDALRHKLLTSNIKYPYTLCTKYVVNGTRYLVLTNFANRTEIKKTERTISWIAAMINTDKGVLIYKTTFAELGYNNWVQVLTIFYPHLIKRWKERLKLQFDNYETAVIEFFKRNLIASELIGFSEKNFVYKNRFINRACFVSDGIILGDLDENGFEHNRTFIPITYLTEEQLEKYKDVMKGKTFNLPNGGTKTF